MRAFVTGGTGLIGWHLVDALLAEGWEAAVLTRDPRRAKDLAARGVSVVEGDVTRPRFHAEAGRADVVFHAAAWFDFGVRDGRRMFEVNVTGTGNVLSIARKEGVPRIVYTSTAGLFAPAPRERPATEASLATAPLADPYVSTKFQAHRLVVGEMHAGLPVTVVLPAAVFGPRDRGQLGRSLALLARGRLRVLPKGLGVNTWAHAADVAEGHLLAATKGRVGEMYLLADRILSYDGFYGEAARLAGLTPPRGHAPRSFVRLAARLSEVRARLAGRTPLLSRALLDLAGLDLVVDAAKARRELGWAPRPFEARIRETMAWYVETYARKDVALPVK